MFWLTVGLLVCASSQAIAAIMEAVTVRKFSQLQGQILGVQVSQVDIQKKQYELQQAIETERRKPRSFAKLVARSRTLASISVCLEITNLAEFPLWIEDGRARVSTSAGIKTPVDAKLIQEDVEPGRGLELDVTPWVSELLQPGDPSVLIQVDLACRMLEHFHTVSTPRYTVTIGREGPIAIEDFR